MHRSNFLLEGFTSEVSIQDLQLLAEETGLPLIYDLGSGSFSEALGAVLPNEPTVKEAIDTGVDLILFSGDKLFGGPQAGFILGREKYIAKIKYHPLLRPLRVDKMTLAALEATLRLYADPNKARENIPLLQMTLIDLEELRERSSRLLARLQEHGIVASLEESSSVLGGGSSPGVQLPSYNVVVTPASSQSAQKLDSALHQAETPVIARIVRERLHFDLRTIRAEEDEDLGSILLNVLKEDK